MPIAIPDTNEFGLLHENAAEVGIDASDIPAVSRVASDVNGRSISAIKWGVGDPAIVLLHGGGQNSHTFDSLALLLNVPVIALDLPGHGRSDWRSDQDYSAWPVADDIAVAIQDLAPSAKLIVGAALGGMALIPLAAARPDIVRRAMIVDVSPDVSVRSTTMTEGQKGASALTRQRSNFPSFDEMVTAALLASPLRDPVAMRRGVWHNAIENNDGTWRWRYDSLSKMSSRRPISDLWTDVEQITSPVVVVRGETSSFVHPDDLAEYRRRLAHLRTVTVAAAGHSVHTDKPHDMAALIHAELTM